MKRTIAELFVQGQYKEVVDIKIYSCGCKDIEMPLATHHDLPDEEIEDLLQFLYSTEDDYEIETTDTELILTTRKDHICKDCRDEKTYCKDMPKPIGFERVMKQHGILAYCRMRTDYEGAKQHLNKVLSMPNYETCCATEALGPVGVTLQGDVITASNYDLRSKVDSKGRYFYKRGMEDVLVYDVKDFIAKGLDNTNTELVTINNKIMNIWIKEGISNKAKQFALELAKIYNAIIVVLPRTEADMMRDDDDDNFYDDMFFF